MFVETRNLSIENSITHLLAMQSSGLRVDEHQDWIEEALVVLLRSELNRSRPKTRTKRGTKP